MRRLRRGRRGLRLIENGVPSGHARPRVLLVTPASSYRLPAYLEAARRLGLEPLIASEGEHALVDAAGAGLHVRFAQPEQALERVLAALRGHPPDAVAGTDDRTVALAARIAARFGLAHNRPEATEVARRKDLARAALAGAGLPVPAFRILDLTRPLGPQVQGVPYPCVVKPLALAGSRGVIRADDPAELQAAVQRVSSILDAEPSLPQFERRRLLVEAFLPGVEVALEGLLHEGRLQMLALFDKPDPLLGPFFEETYYTTPSRLAPLAQARLVERLEQACAAYGLRHGPVHGELRWHGNEAWVVELAARTIGGECARLLRFGTGHGVEDLVLAQAVGRSLMPARCQGGAGVLMIPIPGRGVLRRVEGILEALEVPYIEDLRITAREGYELVPLPEGASYLGFIFARAPDPASAEQALREAHRRLRFVIAPSWRIEAG